MKSRLSEERSNGGTGKDSKNKIGELSLEKGEKYSQVFKSNDSLIGKKNTYKREKGNEKEEEGKKERKG